MVTLPMSFTLLAASLLGSAFAAKSPLEYAETMNAGVTFGTGRLFHDNKRFGPQISVEAVGSQRLEWQMGGAYYVPTIGVAYSSMECPCGTEADEIEQLSGVTGLSWSVKSARADFGLSRDFPSDLIASVGVGFARGSSTDMESTLSLARLEPPSTSQILAGPRASLAWQKQTSAFTWVPMVVVRHWFGVGLGGGQFGGDSGDSNIADIEDAIEYGFGETLDLAKRDFVSPRSSVQTTILIHDAFKNPNYALSFSMGSIVTHPSRAIKLIQQATQSPLDDSQSRRTIAFGLHYYFKGSRNEAPKKQTDGRFFEGRRTDE